MKPVIYILLWAACLFSPVLASANNELQARAEKAYAARQYKDAVKAYEQMLEQGFTSWKLYYNLGNACYKNNELGKAIYYYELANKAEPNNEDIKTNLRLANDKTIDKIESKENFFLGAIKSGLVQALSTTGWAWLSIVSLVTGLLFLLIFFISENVILKRIGFFASGLFMVVFIATMVLGFSALNNKQQIKFAIVLSREVKVMAEPTDVSASKFSLHEGTRIKVLETNEEWTNIRLENGNEGWLKTNAVGLF